MLTSALSLLGRVALPPLLEFRRVDEAREAAGVAYVGPESVDFTEAACDLSWRDTMLAAGVAYVGPESEDLAEEAHDLLWRVVLLAAGVAYVGPESSDRAEDAWEPRRLVTRPPPRRDQVR